MTLEYYESPYHVTYSKGVADEMCETRCNPGKMSKRDRYLLTQAYGAGFLNGMDLAQDDARLSVSLEDEADRWVDEDVDGIGTVGRYICSQAPIGD